MYGKRLNDAERALVALKGVDQDLIEALREAVLNQVVRTHNAILQAMGASFATETSWDGVEYADGMTVVGPFAQERGITDPTIIAAMNTFAHHQTALKLQLELDGVRRITDDSDERRGWSTDDDCYEG